jgi:phosphoglycerate dehydrogenase-like enzyme
MKKQQILITFSPSPEAKAELQEILGSEADLIFLPDIPPDQRQVTLQAATRLLTWNFPREITEHEYPDLQKVKFIQLISAGADHIPFGGLPARVTVASNAGAYALPMAEHVMGMTLALAKRFCIENQKLKNGEFDQGTRNRLLSGLTASILGFGGIGQATARLMRAFNMHIQAINTSGTSSEPVDFIGTLRDLEKVLRASDVVVVCLPLTRATRGCLGEKQLDWMNPDAILINVSRGAILDEHALYEHVRIHPNFLLGIDAWWIEPFRQGFFKMQYPFLDLPNVLGSPHNSAIVSSNPLGAARQAAENMKRYIKGEHVKGIVLREDYL